MPTFPHDVLRRIAGGMAASWAARLASSCAQEPLSKDFMREYILHDGVIPPSLRPPLFGDALFGAVKARDVSLARLEFSCGYLEKAGQGLGGQFDLIDISNIIDMIPDGGLALLRDSVVPLLAPRGAVLARWAKQAGHLTPILEQAGLRVDPELNKQLTTLEVSMFMTECAMGFKD